MRIIPLIASTFGSDGGSMFGLVPRPIWSKRIPPDERNRIPQHAHSLLVELDDGRKGLVDTGCGSAENFSDKEIDLHGLGPGWPLAEALKKRGVAPETIDFVVFSHLHWDHAGGTVAPASLNRALTFPRAEHIVHAIEWEDATSGDPLLYKSYPPHIIERLKQAHLRLVKEDKSEILPGITLARSGGHTRGHCVIMLHADNLNLVHPDAGRFPDTRRFVFTGDICPTRHHLRMVFQTSYDTFPLNTRAWKLVWWPKHAEAHDLILFDHDPDLFGATIKPDPRDEFVVDQPIQAKDD
jgi:glyoxylase-like metal-dependent hydrolase (beta-lactamase superfamily II)